MTDQTSKSDKPKRRQARLTPKLKKLALLLPAVMDGDMTLKAAMLKAGYAESSANQQQAATGALRNNGAMQEAPRKAGFTEEFIATTIMQGSVAERTYRVYEDDEWQERTTPDHDARHKFVKTGAELLDAFPSKKIDHTISDPLGYGDLEGQPKATSPEEARKLSFLGNIP